MEFTVIKERDVIYHEGKIKVKIVGIDGTPNFKYHGFLELAVCSVVIGSDEFNLPEFKEFGGTLLKRFVGELKLRFPGKEIVRAQTHFCNPGNIAEALQIRFLPTTFDDSSFPVADYSKLRTIKGVGAMVKMGYYLYENPVTGAFEFEKEERPPVVTVAANPKTLRQPSFKMISLTIHDGKMQVMVNRVEDKFMFIVEVARPQFKMFLKSTLYTAADLETPETVVAFKKFIGEVKLRFPNMELFWAMPSECEHKHLENVFVERLPKDLNEIPTRDRASLFDMPYAFMLCGGCMVDVNEDGSYNVYQDN
jgi:hypothetical protein